MTGITPERIAEIREYSRLYDENPGFERQWDCSDYVPELLDEIERLRRWISDECPACGGLIAFEATP